MTTESTIPITEEALSQCMEVLQRLCQQPAPCLVAGSPAAEIKQQASLLLRAIKKLQKKDVRLRDEELLDEVASSIRADDSPVSTADPSIPTYAVLARPRTCYVCKRTYTQLHLFYHSLCPPCAEWNYSKRMQTTDLTGKVALVTGARIRIGFQVALKLLRSGASVIATTRFPNDAARRFSRQEDFCQWSDRLSLHGLDLRHIPSIERFAGGLASSPRLDILVNNAAQTIRRPPAYYRRLLEVEREGPLDGAAKLLVQPASPEATGRENEQASLVLSRLDVPLSAALTQVPLLPEDETHDAAVFPVQDGQPEGETLDLREENSWSLLPARVSPVELLEVYLVNAAAPFLLVSRLEPLLMRDRSTSRYVVNVASAEGQVVGDTKTGRHPHTNMSKAALNMLTRTCAERYAEAGLFMNSVDPGWVSLQQPEGAAQTLQEDGWRPPLDDVDAAARILDPVFTGFNTGVNHHGKLWKDYRVVQW